MNREGGVIVRVVVIKSPKLIGGILRRLFGIRKESWQDT